MPKRNKFIVKPVGRKGTSSRKYRIYNTEKKAWANHGKRHIRKKDAQGKANAWNRTKRKKRR